MTTERIFSTSKHLHCEHGVSVLAESEDDSQYSHSDQ